LTVTKNELTTELGAFLFRFSIEFSDYSTTISLLCIRER